jgi:hypothetical protein
MSGEVEITSDERHEGESSNARRWGVGGVQLGEKLAQS